MGTGDGGSGCGVAHDSATDNSLIADSESRLNHQILANNSSRDRFRGLKIGKTLSSYTHTLVLLSDSCAVV